MVATYSILPPKIEQGKANIPPIKNETIRRAAPELVVLKKNRMAMAEEEEWLVVSVVACLLLRTVSSWSYVFHCSNRDTSGVVFAESIQI